MKKAILVFFLSGFCSLSAQAPDMEWQRSYGGSGTDVLSSISQTADGGFIGISRTNSQDHDIVGAQGERDIWLVKLSGSGQIQWKRTMGGSALDFPGAIMQNPDGTYMMVGNTSSGDGDVADNITPAGTIWIAKLDASGQTIWQHFFGAAETEVYGYKIVPTTDGYAILGETSYGNDMAAEFYGETDIWLLEIDHNGTMLWEKSLGGNYDDLAGGLLRLDDGYAISASTDSTQDMITDHYGEFDAWITRINSSGSPYWQKNYGGSGYDYSRVLLKTPDGGLVSVGHSDSNNFNISDSHGLSDGWIFKTDADGNLIWSKTFGGPLYDAFMDARLLADGSILAVGSKDNVITAGQAGSLGQSWMVRIDGNGNLMWETTFGGSNTETASTLALTQDGACIVSSLTNSTDSPITQAYGAFDIWLTKFEPFVLSSPTFERYGVTCYPNPVQDVLHWSDGAFAVEIATMQGRSVTSGSNGAIDLSLLASGIYVAKFRDQSGTKTFTHKIVKK